MFTLGYRFKPWLDQKAIADGPSILRYVRETARENDLEANIRFGHRVKRASWSSETARWTLEVERKDSGERATFTCNFLYACTGYYRYEAGYTPEFEGVGDFQGRIVHPQHWTDDIAYEGKRVIVIGSGATAVTLVPELSKRAAEVVMLQRSPTYMVSMPARDRAANFVRKLLPTKLAYFLVRWRNILRQLVFFRIARRWPRFARRSILKQVRALLGPDYDVRTHFAPHYNVWDQRVCLVPDADMFDAIREGRVTVVTDHIDRFTPTGIRLRSGNELQADLIVTATGLDLVFFGGIEIDVDGRVIHPNDTFNYKGCMFSDVPNLAYTFGYTNASWTLKADLTAEYICRLLNHMDAVGAKRCTPRPGDTPIAEQPWLEFTSGYIQRALSIFPKQGLERPWRLYQNYALDVFVLRHGKIDDGTLELQP